VDGQLVGTLAKPAGTWLYPTGLDIFCCDRDAEMGALRNPEQGLVLNLGDSYDPGVRNFFSGHMAEMKTWNYALTDQQIADEFSALTSVEAPQQLGLKVFPNPAHDQLTVVMEEAGSAQLSLMDMQGRLVLKTEVQAQTELSLDHVPAGIYLLKVTQGDKLHLQKLVIR
jgi:hypothetical protein